MRAAAPMSPVSSSQAKSTFSISCSGLTSQASPQPWLAVAWDQGLVQTVLPHEDLGLDAVLFGPQLEVQVVEQPTEDQKLASAP